jgi:hypothetical protein
VTADADGQCVADERKVDLATKAVTHITIVHRGRIRLDRARCLGERRRAGHIFEQTARAGRFIERPPWAFEELNAVKIRRIEEVWLSPACARGSGCRHSDLDPFAEYSRPEVRDALDESLRDLEASRHEHCAKIGAESCRIVIPGRTSLKGISTTCISPVPAPR